MKHIDSLIPKRRDQWFVLVVCLGLVAVVVYMTFPTLELVAMHWRASLALGLLVLVFGVGRIHNLNQANEDNSTP